MELENFYQELPKIELHAHLNGSLSPATLLKLKRFHADTGLLDKTNAFIDEFFVAAGDSRTLSDCFQVFNIAHALTTTQEAVSLATSLTLEEFHHDGCVYVELRSTPRETESMTRAQYIEAIVKTIQKCSSQFSIKSRLIVSLDRRCSLSIANDITSLAINYYKKYPDVVVGLELSGDPTIGKFQDFVPYLEQARKAGLKITLHCGEVSNAQEVLEMLHFMPNRIGHGVCIHPRLGGSDEIWEKLCQIKIPVEICLTSNVNTKLTEDYKSHHFKELHDADIPVIICTDDKGVFSTSLSQEYRLCAEIFSLSNSEIAKIALNSINYIFAEDIKKELHEIFLIFLKKYKL